MGNNILILACVSGFLDKFEKENVKILKGLGFGVHYAANMREQHYLFDPQEFEQMGIAAHHIDIERSPYMLRNNRKAYKQVLKIIEENDIGLIHCHSPVGGMIGRLAGRHCQKRRRKLTVIYTAHGFHFYKGAPLINNTLYYFAEKYMARYTDVLITINEEDYKNGGRLPLRKVKAENGKPEKRVYRIPGIGLDLERFRPLTEEERERERKRLGVQDKFFLVSCGELNENKNQYIVLKALAKIREEGRDISRIRYGICGEGFFHSRLESWIRELQLEQNVILYGYCMDIRRIVGCADASIFPSLREGLGMAGVEALAMEVPLIAADNRGTREYMTHGSNGYVCDGRDEESVKKGIEYIADIGAEQRRTMGRRGRESVMGFDKKYTNQVMEQIYAQFLGKTGQ